MKIPFNKVHTTGNELAYISQALQGRQLAGGGPFTEKCSAWLRRGTGSVSALLTQSCTAALEMAAILAEIKPGDEIIMPAYTFVSTANAFVLRGGVPVFVDIRADTLNLDETRIEAAITSRTKAIVAVHYAGVACEMDNILAIAAQYGLLVIEDAAQGVMAHYKGHRLGSLGDLGTYSFHDSKNITSGEGGALLVNNARFADRAEVILEKGTNRSQFFQGLVDKYTWCDLGSSFLPSELTAACLYAQLESEVAITQQRLAIWETYHAGFGALEHAGHCRRPIVPAECAHNGHLYYLLLPTPQKRAAFISHMKAAGVTCVFHYVPLHTSPMGRRVARTAGSMTITQDTGERLVRLPLWPHIEPHLPMIIAAATTAAMAAAS